MRRALIATLTPTNERMPLTFIVVYDTYIGLATMSISYPWILLFFYSLNNIKNM